MKRVLFTQRVELVEAYKERRDCADQRIAEYINSCGFLPVPIPNCVVGCTVCRTIYTRTSSVRLDPDGREQSGKVWWKCSGQR